MTGNYILSIVNGTAMTLTEDAGGDLIGYYVNTTAGTQIHQSIMMLELNYKHFYWTHAEW